mmetsp:Transcript_2855/g.6110  ORF Transcript_2855/g.6110 Transcript_2855/m.6110 type:complete len:82 (-) Transcript_2855:28-273(-)
MDLSSSILTSSRMENALGISTTIGLLKKLWTSQCARDIHCFWLKMRLERKVQYNCCLFKPNTTNIQAWHSIHCVNNRFIIQ